ncbi:uncharacterized protein LOC116613146 isoform X2 [Nematostella vectensis]|uniref:uncharacterized protein LOC116613146 isoform X2 n=1 Tax=Nematostella vectensis TaxID=45351 RepID=UPI0020779764|nr:uncharacterized protein LOC116613146 isoform X2 [Nematostella vectensis]
MLMLAEAGRSLNKNLISLFRHDSETPQILERLVHEIHTDKELCSYMFLNHPGSEDMLLGLLNLLDSEDSRVAGNAAYVIGTLAEMDLGKKRIVQICTDNSDSEQTKRILPSLTRMLEMVDMETVMNAAGTMGTLAENEDCRIWMLKEDCLDEAIDKLTRLLSCKDSCTASNAALVLARFTIAEEGCARILNQRCSSRTLVQLIKALGTDDTGRGMNAAFAIGRLCDLEAGCARILAMPESRRLLTSLIKMLSSDDIGCSKNACFALSCIASFPQGHTRLLAHPDIDEIVLILSGILASPDEEIVWFSAMMLHTLASQKSGCLYLRTQEVLKPALQAVLDSKNIRKDTKEEVEETLAILEKLPQPKPPKLNVESAYTILVDWEAMNPKSGLDVFFELFQDGETVYEGHRNSYIASSLTPVTSYSFCVRAFTEGDEGHTSKNVSATTPESVPSAPQFPRVAAKTTNQIKIMWDPPETANGVLKAYQVVTRGRTTYLDISENYLILSGLPTDTEYTFEIYALTSKGRGEAALLTTRTDDLASHAPPKPTLQALGRHEILVTWDHPPRPLGRINSFEVKVDKQVIYTGIDKSCIARFLKPNTEYTITVSAWTSEGRCESLPARKRTAREIYRKTKDCSAKIIKQTTTKRSANKLKIPIRKPLYPFETIPELKPSEKEIKRARTAETAPLPNVESKTESKTRLRKSNSSVESKPRPNTSAGVPEANEKNNSPANNRTTRKSIVRRNSRFKAELSASLDSIKDKVKEDADPNTTLGAKIERRPSISREGVKPLSSKPEAREQKRPTKGPRRNSLPGVPIAPVKSARSPLFQSQANRNSANRQSPAIKTKADLDWTKRDTPTLIGEMSDSLTTLRIKKPTSGKESDEKPAKKTTFADSFSELRQVHRTNQSTNATRQPNQSGGLTLTTLSPNSSWQTNQSGGLALTSLSPSLNRPSSNQSPSMSRYGNHSPTKRAREAESKRNISAQFEISPPLVTSSSHSLTQSPTLLVPHRLKKKESIP